MSNSKTKENLLTAAKQLAESEIQLLKAVETSSNEIPQHCRRKTTMSEQNITSKRTSARVINAKASQVIIAAKQKAMERKKGEKKLADIPISDIYQKSMDALQNPSFQRKATGLVYEDTMLEHRCAWDENYPECPERYSEILKRCEELGLGKRCQFIEPRMATKEELLLKHDRRLIDDLEMTSGCGDFEKLEALSSKYDAIYMHASTYEAACLAAGSTINLLSSICGGEIQNGMAVVRPPGHHAMKGEYCGYCFFNNVAVAVEKVLSENLAKKVLIVDWDVHHGQGTQQMFYTDPRVVYFSIHRYEHGEFWPNLPESDFNYVGEDSGEGFNFNVPLNKTGMTNADYIAVFQQLLLPMAYEFQPDLVIISAGYDAAVGCPEGEMEVTPACYAHLLSSLLSLGSGRVAVIVEGGYCLKSLAEGAALTLATLLGDPCPFLQNLEEPSDSIRDTILSVIYAHRPYWNCYQYQDTYSINSVSSSHLEENSDRFMPVVKWRGKPSKASVYETRNCYPVQSAEVKNAIEKKLNFLIHVTNLKKAKHRVGIVYDTVMMQHQDPSDDSHPEKPSRIHGIWSKCHEAGVIKRCLILNSRLATDEELLLGHKQDYIDMIKRTENSKAEDLEKLASEYNSVYLHGKTWSNACLAAGSLLRVVDSVLAGEIQSGVAVIRPPGHHAEEDAPCGFCIFNNVALAAKYAVQFHHLKRVLIVDWDIHHGNGIQSIVKDDPTILYISVHRYDRGTFFPNSKDANYDQVGVGKGEGFNVNIPWNKKGMGDSEYIAAFQQVVLPIAYQYNPELVLVSAGFDACIGDPLGGCKVTPEMYGHLTHWLSSLANGRIILSLEGGYNINSISYAMTMCVKSLLGDPLPLLESSQTLNPSAIVSINNTLRVQKQYWCNLKFQMALPKELDVLVRSSISAEAKMDTSEDEKMAKLQAAVKSLTIDSSAGNRDYNANVKEGQEKCADSDKQQQSSSEEKEKEKSSQNSQEMEISVVPSSSSSSSSSAATSSMATLSEYLSENLQALANEEMFAVIPLTECPHVDIAVKPLPESGIDVHAACQECDTTKENWICLECYTVHCARSINRHGLEHYQQHFEHSMSLSFSDLSVWCYACEAYIDNPRLYAARNAAHRNKFDQDLPWTYEQTADFHAINSS